MKVFIKVFTGKILTLICTDNDDIASIKKQIEQIDRVAVSRQRLIFMGLELIDQHLISHYKIQDGSTIICECSVLMVMLPDGDAAMIPINSTETILDVKRKIEEKKGIAWIDQRMFYSCCSFRGRQLEDSKTVSENRIGGNVVYVLDTLPESQLFIEILESTRKSLNIPVKMNSTILSIKKKSKKKFLITL